MKQRKNFWERLAETFSNLSDGMTFFGFFTFRGPHTPYQKSQTISEEELLEDEKTDSTAS